MYDISVIALCIHGYREVNEKDIDDHMDSMLKWADSINEKALKNITSVQQKQKKQYDAKHTLPTFKVGDDVWVYNSRKDTRQGGKLEYNWKGPYEVMEQTTRGTYRLKNKNGILLKQAVSSIRLKACTGMEENPKKVLYKYGFMRPL